MTEMVFGTTPVRAGDPILPRWWRTLDKWSLACVLGLFAIGILNATMPLVVREYFPHHVPNMSLTFMMSSQIMLAAAPIVAVPMMDWAENMGLPGWQILGHGQGRHQHAGRQLAECRRHVGNQATDGSRWTLQAQLMPQHSQF